MNFIHDFLPPGFEDFFPTMSARPQIKGLTKKIAAQYDFFICLPIHNFKKFFYWIPTKKLNFEESFL